MSEFIIDQIFPFIHYEEYDCADIVHVHFDCPICNQKYAGTDYVNDPDDIGKIFYCEECHAQFQIMSNEKIKFLGLTEG